MNDRLSETKQAFQEPEWYFNKRDYHVRVRVETVGELLNGAGFERILDIGCGDGSISLPLLTETNRLTWLDMSDGMLARARARIPSGLSASVEIINGDFMGARLETNAYDLIICLGVLAYIDPVQPFLDKLTSLLKPGGTVIIEWTDGHHFMNRLQQPYHGAVRALAGEKVRLAVHSSAEIIGQFKRLGFERAGSYRYCSPLPVVRKLLGRQLNYRLIRAVNGNAIHNRAAWLGDECIYHFRSSGERSRL
jgi:2-polyprenyl-3-methyl-5-hydroxy-6-metoxy-1,4-benzoquinol methylase